MPGKNELAELKSELARHRHALNELTALALPGVIGSPLEFINGDPRAQAMLSRYAPVAAELWREQHPPKEYRDPHTQTDGPDEDNVHRQAADWVDPVGGGTDPRWSR